MFDISSRSRRAGLGLLVAAFGIVALGACGSAESGPLVTEDNAEFVVSIGDEFTIVLEANVTTGFSWQLETPLDESILVHVDDDYIAPGTDAVGSPGKQELTFRAVGNGSTRIDLWYIRSFDSPPDPAEKDSFPVIVEPG